MLKGYQVEYVFGLPGETTLQLYKEWRDYPEIHHVMARDERSASFMADGYARFSGKPGVCEAPSVGATHVLPGVAEAYKSCIPLIMLTTDIPLHMEKQNMFTGIDQTSMFEGLTKESMTVTEPSCVPNYVRRAFRIATTGRPGPVHIRLPSDILAAESKYSDLSIQNDFTRYPGHRPVAQTDKIVEALKLLGMAEKPVIVCGQGVLNSQAWDEIIQLSELFAAPMGTTISGKGSVPEKHPLSIGVVGARGGRNLSNKVLIEADLVFFIGSSTDSSNTDRWTVPPIDSKANFIHLNVSEQDLGNNYPNGVNLLGDAKATLTAMLSILSMKPREFNKLPRINALQAEKKKHADYLADIASKNETPINPVRFIKELEKALPRDRCLVMDVGTPAIYISAYYQVPEAGRSLAFNFGVGSLGYAIPASIGASYARQNSCIVTLVGDGSFGFTLGELETMKRSGYNNNIVLIDNQSFGWIRAESSLIYGPDYTDFATNFQQVDYIKIAEGFGLKAVRVENPTELGSVFEECFNNSEPTLIDVLMAPEDKLVPPVPKWIRKAQERGIRYLE